MISFADSTRPAAIPASFRFAALYANGKYAAPPEQVARFRHFTIAVLPGQPAQARIARCLDIERYDATDQDFPPFAAERHDLGHDDATAYRDLSGVPALLDAMTGVKIPWWLWVAWWWGRTYPPTAHNVIRELRALYGVDLPPHRLWACQWASSPTYDMSILYGRRDFTR